MDDHHHHTTPDPIDSTWTFHTDYDIFGDAKESNILNDFGWNIQTPPESILGIDFGGNYVTEKDNIPTSSSSSLAAATGHFQSGSIENNTSDVSMTANTLPSSSSSEDHPDGSGDVELPPPPETGGKVKNKGPKRIRQQRFAFMTKSEIDQLEDGYRWRKYGQKAVKNSPFPRSYYRCTNGKCTVKKKVERSSSDPTTVITTYEGRHCHHTIGFPRGLLNQDQGTAYARYLAPSSTSSSQQLVYPRAQLPQIGNLGLSRLHSLLHPRVVEPREKAENHGSVEQPVDQSSSFQADSRVDQGLLGDIVSPKTRN